MATEEITNKPKNRILFFDNEPFLVKSLTQHLKLLGWDVKLVPNIDELFKELEQNNYDILILDIKAPIPIINGKYVSFKPSEINSMNDGMKTGVVLAKKIWEDNKKYNSIPILFHSAKTNPIPGDSVLESHKCDYIRKPERVKNIDQKLNDLLVQKTN